MSKKTKQQKRRGHKNQKKVSIEQPNIVKWLAKFWRWIVAGSVVLTIIGSLLTLSPSITVSSSQSLDIQNPFATPFIIRNDSLLPIHSIEISCVINKISYGNRVEVTHALFGYENPPIPILTRNEQKTFLCKDRAFENLITYGDIGINISYRPDYLFWRKNKTLRFITVRDKSGVIYWYPKPLSEQN